MIHFDICFWFPVWFMLIFFCTQTCWSKSIKIFFHHPQRFPPPPLWSMYAKLGDNVSHESDVTFLETWRLIGYWSSKLSPNFASCSDDLVANGIKLDLLHRSSYKILNTWKISHFGCNRDPVARVHSSSKSPSPPRTRVNFVWYVRWLIFINRTSTTKFTLPSWPSSSLRHLDAFNIVR